MFHGQVQKELLSLPDWDTRLERSTQLLSGLTPFPNADLAVAAESFYKKLKAADSYKPSGTYRGPVTLVKSTDNFVTLDKDYNLTPVSTISVCCACQHNDNTVSLWEKQMEMAKEAVEW